MIIKQQYLILEAIRARPNGASRAALATTCRLSPQEVDMWLEPLLEKDIIKVRRPKGRPLFFIKRGL